MSRHAPARNGRTLPELLEAVENGEIDNDALVRLLAEEYPDETPLHRIETIIESARQRLDGFEEVSLSVESRAPRAVDLHDLQYLSGIEFESLLAEVLSRVDGTAEPTKAAGDQGVDVLWHRSKGVVAVQAKAYDRENTVSNRAVQEVNTGKRQYESEFDIIGTAVVTTSYYTESAEALAESANVTLYNRDDVRRWLQTAQISIERLDQITS